MIMNKWWTCSLGVLAYCFPAEAQEKQDTIKPLTIQAYVEGYYAWNSKPTSEKPAYLFSHNRLHEFSVNLALVKLAYQDESVRSTIGLGVGSYMQANYSAEEGVWKQVYEANVGLKLGKYCWIDLGVLPSHIGAESAIGMDNISLSRSLSAENSPYFETGAKLSYSSSKGNWYAAVLALNGWQRIQKSATQKGLAYGHQLQYKPNNSVILNSSSYLAEEGKDSLRFFHNFYVQYSPGNKLQLLANVDFGSQENPSSGKSSNWWNTGMQVRYGFHKNWSMNFRAEYFADKSRYFLLGLAAEKDAVWGTSIGTDFIPYKNMIWRLEYRYLESHGLSSSLAWRF